MQGIFWCNTISLLFCLKQYSSSFSLSVTPKGTSDSSETLQLALQRVCETRWACRFEVIRAVDANFSVLLDLLEKIEDHPNSDAKAVADA